MTYRTTQKVTVAPAPNESLRHSMQRLERALAAKTAGREYQWSASVADALAQMQQEIQRKRAETATPDKLAEEIDMTRPSLVRRVEALHRDFADCLERATSLYTEVKDVTRSFSPREKGKEVARTRPIPDFGELRRRAADLLESLKRDQETEAKLILESMNTDIGVGD
jgi:hypothetical protein